LYLYPEKGKIKNRNIMDRPFFIQTSICLLLFSFYTGLSTTARNKDKNSTTVGPVSILSKEIKDYHTSWLANDGGKQATHIPHDMLNLYVRGDGTVATICFWDEGGSNVAIFRDGKLISVPEGSGTGGWGRMSGYAVAMDDNFVYQLLTQHGCDGANNDMNINGLPQYPPCDEKIEWKTIRRYNVETGLSAPFGSGFGYKGDMLLVCKEKSRNMEGLAITDKELFVTVSKGDASLNMEDSIFVFNKSALSSTPVRKFKVSGGIGKIYADDKNGLWMLQKDKIIRLDQKTGKRLSQSVALPEGVIAKSFSVDIVLGRILVANSGKDLDILIYGDIYNQPVLTGRFGEKGGILSKSNIYKKGEYGPKRFMGPQGVGVDKKGHIYICNTFVSGGRGAIIEAYDETTGNSLWNAEGLIFTATADFDREIENIYYTPEKIHLIDYSKTGGRIDKFVGVTVDPFMFPNDQRAIPDGPFITSVFKRSLNGVDCVFVSDMYGGMLAGYRFDEESHGYIAIPFMRINQVDGDIVTWQDKNENGKEEEYEISVTKNPNIYSMSHFVDQAGNIWKGCREQGFTLWKMIGNDSLGVPQYGEPLQFNLPEGIDGIKRIFYDAAKDALYLTGFSSEYPDKGDTWWAAGSTIAKYDNVLARINKNPKVNTSAWKPELLLYVEFQSGQDGDGANNLKAFTVEGDYIFGSIARNGYITVYDNKTGKYKGYVRPGREVGGQSGWTDFNYAINAKRNEDGSYYILNEENAFAKVMHYRLIIK
jgi:hypothetical protein